MNLRTSYDNAKTIAEKTELLNDYIFGDDYSSKFELYILSLFRDYEVFSLNKQDEAELVAAMAYLLQNCNPSLVTTEANRFLEYASIKSLNNKLVLELIDLLNAASDGLMVYSGVLCVQQQHLDFPTDVQMAVDYHIAIHLVVMADNVADDEERTIIRFNRSMWSSKMLEKYKDASDTHKKRFINRLKGRHGNLGLLRSEVKTFDSWK